MKFVDFVECTFCAMLVRPDRIDEHVLSHHMRPPKAETVPPDPLLTQEEMDAIGKALESLGFVRIR